MNDQFKGGKDSAENWERYLALLEEKQGVAVLGITDYLTIANYSKMLQLKQTGRLENIHLLIPNVEFRILPQPSGGSAINVHLLICPDDAEHEKRINEALGRLHVTISGKWSCTPDQIRELGRRHAVDPSNPQHQLSVGTELFRMGWEVWRAWLNNEPWLKANALVLVSGRGDGPSGLSGDGAAGVRDEIYKFAHVILSSNETDRRFWAGETSIEEKTTKMRALGGPKPCVHGSDAHDWVKLLQPDQERYCWIKADPSWEGLRQILLEPALRVRIGKEPPALHADRDVIERLEIVCPDSGWFLTKEILFNRGLVAIVGPRGSGKSALAELVAYAAGSWQKADGKSFVERSSRSGGTSGLVAILHWANGEASAAPLDSNMPDGDRVQYLSQQFVEQLCSSELDGSKLVEEIEKVIFAHTPVPERLNASSFSDLRDKITRTIQEERGRLKSKIFESVQERLRLYERLGSLPEKQKRVLDLEGEARQLSAEIRTIATGDEKAYSEQLAKEQQSLVNLQRQAATVRQKIDDADRLDSRLQDAENWIANWYAEIEPLLESIGIPPATQTNYRLVFSGEVRPPLAARRAALIGELQRIEGPNAGGVPTIVDVESRIAVIAGQANTNQSLRDRLTALQTRLTRTNATIEQIKQEMAIIEGPERQRYDATRQTIVDQYVTFFGTLRREQTVLRKLYEPVEKELAKRGDTERPLEFFIRWHFDVEGWCERLENMIDGRRVPPFGSIGAFREFAEDQLRNLFEQGDTDAARQALGLIREKLDIPRLPPSNWLKPTAGYSEFASWLYDVDHTRISYGLKYAGTELNWLSPGTKGIVLLTLYLLMNREDRRPLIIDQPEENLDNESIYASLVPHFVRSKSERQILLVTHNPNLVVNTDAEQVIVAECHRDEVHPYLSYTCGSIEDVGPGSIRERICGVLEGGTDAFLRRDRRYALETSRNA